jgi:hypothetical protein
MLMNASEDTFSETYLLVKESIPGESKYLAGKRKEEKTQP